MVETSQIRDALTAAFPDVGSYRFGEGQTTPAIRVEGGELSYPEDPAVTGLEIVIVVSPEINMEPMLGGWQDSYTWLVIFKQWDTQATTLPYRRRLVSTLAQFNTIRIDRMTRVTRQTRLDHVEVMSVRLTEIRYVEESYF